MIAVLKSVIRRLEMFFKGQLSGVKKRRVVKVPLRRKKKVIRRKKKVIRRKGHKRRR